MNHIAPLHEPLIREVLLARPASYARERAQDAGRSGSLAVATDTNSGAAQYADGIAARGR